jgi:transposase-like protein
VSRYHFPMYLKEIEFRFNHRRDNTFKLFLKAYLGYVSP